MGLDYQLEPAALYLFDLAAARDIPLRCPGGTDSNNAAAAPASFPNLMHSIAPTPDTSHASSQDMIWNPNVKHRPATNHFMPISSTKLPAIVELGRQPTVACTSAGTAIVCSNAEASDDAHLVSALEGAPSDLTAPIHSPSPPVLPVHQPVGAAVLMHPELTQLDCTVADITQSDPLALSWPAASGKCSSNKPEGLWQHVGANHNCSGKDVVIASHLPSATTATNAAGACEEQLISDHHRDEGREAATHPPHEGSTCKANHGVIGEQPTSMSQVDIIQEQISSARQAYPNSDGQVLPKTDLKAARLTSAHSLAQQLSEDGQVTAQNASEYLDANHVASLDSQMREEALMDPVGAGAGYLVIKQAQVAAPLSVCQTAAGQEIEGEQTDCRPSTDPLSAPAGSQALGQSPANNLTNTARKDAPQRHMEGEQGKSGTSVSGGADVSPVAQGQLPRNLESPPKTPEPMPMGSAEPSEKASAVRQPSASLCRSPLQPPTHLPPSAFPASSQPVFNFAMGSGVLSQYNSLMDVDSQLSGMLDRQQGPTQNQIPGMFGGTQGWSQFPAATPADQTCESVAEMRERSEETEPKMGSSIFALDSVESCEQESVEIRSESGRMAQQPGQATGTELLESRQTEAQSLASHQQGCSQDARMLAGIVHVGSSVPKAASRGAVASESQMSASHLQVTSQSSPKHGSASRPLQSIQSPRHQPTSPLPPASASILTSEAHENQQNPEVASYISPNKAHHKRRPPSLSPSPLRGSQPSCSVSRDHAPSADKSLTSDRSQQTAHHNPEASCTERVSERIEGSYSTRASEFLACYSQVKGTGPENTQEHRPQVAGPDTGQEAKKIGNTDGGSGGASDVSGRGRETEGNSGFSNSPAESQAVVNARPESNDMLSEGVDRVEGEQKDEGKENTVGSSQSRSCASDMSPFPQGDSSQLFKCVSQICKGPSGTIAAEGRDKADRLAQLSQADVTGRRGFRRWSAPRLWQAASHPGSELQHSPDIGRSSEVMTESSQSRKSEDNGAAAYSREEPRTSTERRAATSTSPPQADQANESRVKSNTSASPQPGMSLVAQQGERQNRQDSERPLAEEDSMRPAVLRDRGSSELVHGGDSRRSTLPRGSAACNGMNKRSVKAQIAGVLGKRANDLTSEMAGRTAHNTCTEEADKDLTGEEMDEITEIDAEAESPTARRSTGSGTSPDFAPVRRASDIRRQQEKHQAASRFVACEESQIGRKGRRTEGREAEQGQDNGGPWLTTACRHFCEYQEVQANVSSARMGPSMQQGEGDGREDERGQECRAHREAGTTDRLSLSSALLPTNRLGFQEEDPESQLVGRKRLRKPSCGHEELAKGRDKGPRGQVAVGRGGGNFELEALLWDHLQAQEDEIKRKEKIQVDKWRARTAQLDGRDSTLRERQIALEAREAAQEAAMRDWEQRLREWEAHLVWRTVQMRRQVTHGACQAAGEDQYGRPAVEESTGEKEMEEDAHIPEGRRGSDRLQAALSVSRGGKDRQRSQRRVGARNGTHAAEDNRRKGQHKEEANCVRFSFKGRERQEKYARAGVSPRSDLGACPTQKGPASDGRPQHDATPPRPGVFTFPQSGSSMALRVQTPILLERARAGTEGRKGTSGESATLAPGKRTKAELSTEASRNQSDQGLNVDKAEKGKMRAVADDDDRADDGDEEEGMPAEEGDKAGGHSAGEGDLASDSEEEPDSEKGQVGLCHTHKQVGEKASLDRKKFTRRAALASTADPHEVTFAELWSYLKQQQGWTRRVGSGLIDWYWFPPGGKVEGGRRNSDFFTVPEDVMKYARARGYYSDLLAEYQQSPGPVLEGDIGDEQDRQVDRGPGIGRGKGKPMRAKNMSREEGAGCEEGTENGKPQRSARVTSSKIVGKGPGLRGSPSRYVCRYSTEDHRCLQDGESPVLMQAMEDERTRPKGSAIKEAAQGTTMTMGGRQRLSADDKWTIGKTVKQWWGHLNRAGWKYNTGSGLQDPYYLRAGKQRQGGKEGEDWFASAEAWVRWVEQRGLERVLQEGRRVLAKGKVGKKSGGSKRPRASSLEQEPDTQEEWGVEHEASDHAAEADNCGGCLPMPKRRKGLKLFGLGKKEQEGQDLTPPEQDVDSELSGFRSSHKKPPLPRREEMGPRQPESVKGKTGKDARALSSPGQGLASPNPKPRSDPSAKAEGAVGMTGTPSRITRSSLLAGLKFLLSGVDEQREYLEGRIRNWGGKVLKTLAEADEVIKLRKQAISASHSQELGHNEASGVNGGAREFALAGEDVANDFVVIAAPRAYRRIKYVWANASGAHIVHPGWLESCISSQELQLLNKGAMSGISTGRDFHLPVGYSLLHNRFVFQPPGHAEGLFKGRCIILVCPTEANGEDWKSVFTASQAYAERVQDIDDEWLQSHQVDYVIGYHPWPKSSDARENLQSVEIVKKLLTTRPQAFFSFDWAVQCFIDGELLSAKQQRSLRSNHLFFGSRLPVYAFRSHSCFELGWSLEKDKQLHCSYARFFVRDQEDPHAARYEVGDCVFLSGGTTAEKSKDEGPKLFGRIERLVTSSSPKGDRLEVRLLTQEADSHPFGLTEASQRVNVSVKRLLGRFILLTDYDYKRHSAYSFHDPTIYYTA